MTQQTKTEAFDVVNRALVKAGFPALLTDAWLDLELVKRAVPLLVKQLDQITSHRAKAGLFNLLLARRTGIDPGVALRHLSNLRGAIIRKEFGGDELCWTLTRGIREIAVSSQYDAIVDLLQDEAYGESREHLANALALPAFRDRKKETASVLLNLLASDTTLTHGLIEALGRLRARAAIPYIVPYLKNDEYWWTRWALRRMGVTPGMTNKEAEALADAAHSPIDDLLDEDRTEELEDLTRFLSDRGIPELSVLESDPVALKKAAPDLVRQLDQMPSLVAREAIVNVLKTKKSGVNPEIYLRHLEQNREPLLYRENGAEMLASQLADALSLTAKAAQYNGIIALLQDPAYETVHIYFAHSLIRAPFKKRRPESISLLIKLLSEDDEMAYLYIEILGKLGAKEAIPKLRPFLMDSRSDVREITGSSLRRLGALPVVSKKRLAGWRATAARIPAGVLDQRSVDIDLDDLESFLRSLSQVLDGGFTETDLANLVGFITDMEIDETENLGFHVTYKGVQEIPLLVYAFMDDIATPDISLYSRGPLVDLLLKLAPPLDKEDLDPSTTMS